MELREEGISVKKIDKIVIKELILLNQPDLLEHLNFLSRAPIISEYDPDQEADEKSEKFKEIAAKKDKERSIFNVFSESSSLGAMSKSNGNLAQQPLPAQEERAVRITEWGIDIMNNKVKSMLKPIYKPRISNPSEEMCYLKDSRVIFKPFASTARYGSIQNTIFSFDSKTLKDTHTKCKEMEANRTAREIKSLCHFRKTFKFDTDDTLRGLSFRGRSVLEAKIGWLVTSVKIGESRIKRRDGSSQTFFQFNS